MKLICVGGLSSECGKTSVVCMLLRSLPGWAAVKVTPSRIEEACPRGRSCEACRIVDGRYEVTVDDGIPERPRKDTMRFHEAGAAHVGFVRALPEHLPEALNAAYKRLDGVRGVIVESTTMMPIIQGLRILTAKEGLYDVKDSARRAAGVTDILVVNRNAGQSGKLELEKVPLTQETSGRIMTVCASLALNDPSNIEFIEECLLYAGER